MNAKDYQLCEEVRHAARDLGLRIEYNANSIVLVKYCEHNLTFVVQTVEEAYGFLTALRFGVEHGLNLGE